MVVRRSGARRRRLVVDPAVHSGDVEAGDNATAVSNRQPAPSSPPRRKKSRQTDTRTYSYSAERRSQLKTTDLIPKRVLSYLLVVLVLLAALGIINFLATQAPHWQARIGESGLSALAISGPGSLANWFLSFLLIMTALSCLQIYAIRQHRCNDYRGTYRIWIWMAALSMTASVGCVVDLAGLASNLAEIIVTKQTLADRMWLPVAAKLAMLTIVAAVVIYEVRATRGSMALVTFVWAAFTMAIVMQVPAAESRLSALDSKMVVGNCLLFGTAAMLLAHLTYGRFIFLQANGLIEQKSRIKKSSKKKIAAAKKKRKKADPKISNEPIAKPNKSRRSTPATADTKPVCDEQPTANSKTSPKANPKSKSKKRASQRAVADESPQSTRVSKDVTKSPSEVLKELAAASRAKEQSRTSHVDAFDDESSGVIKMSKAQRRKQRKLEKQRRRAA